MFKTLCFLFIASVITASVVWMLDHDGSIIISWLGYEARTDILTGILLTIIFTLTVSVLAYIIAKILAIRFPGFSKLFFKNPRNPLGWGEDKYAKVSALRLKFKAALDKKNEEAAIIYAKQILAVKLDNSDVVKLLTAIYEKREMRQEAQNLAQEHGSK